MQKTIRAMGKFINPFTDVGRRCVKNMEILERMPWAAQNAVFQKLAEVAEISKLSKKDCLAYDHALKRLRDTYNTITGAEMKGRAEGMLQGIEKANRDNAIKMKVDGMPTELIAKYTGLSVETITACRQTETFIE